MCRPGGIAVGSLRPAAALEVMASLGRGTHGHSGPPCATTCRPSWPCERRRCRDLLPEAAGGPRRRGDAALADAGGDTVRAFPPERVRRLRAWVRRVGLGLAV